MMNQFGTNQDNSKIPNRQKWSTKLEDLGHSKRVADYVHLHLYGTCRQGCNVAIEVHIVSEHTFDYTSGGKW